MIAYRCTACAAVFTDPPQTCSRCGGELVPPPPPLQQQQETSSRRDTGSSTPAYTPKSPPNEK